MWSHDGERQMALELVVVRAFGGHRKGDAITDEAEIARVLGSEQAASVVRVQRGTQTLPKQGS